MKTATLVLLTFALLLCAGCGNKIDSKLDELAAKPATTDLKGAKALYDEVNNLVRWHEDPENEKMSAKQLARAKALRGQRRNEVLALLKDKTIGSLSEVFGGIDLGSIDVGKKVGEATDWVLGINDPRMKKFACKDANGREVDVYQEGAAKLCR